MGQIEIGSGAIDGDGAKIGEDWGRKCSEYGPYIYEIFTAWINKNMNLEPDLVVKAYNPSYPGGWGRRIFNLRTAWAAKWDQVNFDQSNETPPSQIISLKMGWGEAGRQGHCLSCTRHWFKPQDREGGQICTHFQSQHSGGFKFEISPGYRARPHHKDRKCRRRGSILWTKQMRKYLGHEPEWGDAKDSLSPVLLYISS